MATICSSGRPCFCKVSMGVVRSTFLIDENGVIEKVMPKVKPDTNPSEVLAYLQEEK